MLLDLRHVSMSMLVGGKKTLLRRVGRGRSRGGRGIGAIRRRGAGQNQSAGCKGSAGQKSSMRINHAVVVFPKGVGGTLGRAQYEML